MSRAAMASLSLIVTSNEKPPLYKTIQCIQKQKVGIIPYFIEYAL